MNNRMAGKAAEEKATAYLKEKKFSIITQNYHAGRLGEIDIICENDQYLIFVEVKSSRFDDFGNPVFRVDKKKQKQIALIAEIYLAHNPTAKDCRFDVIVLIGSKIVHYEDAFRT